jgi:hypothetical protein
MIADEDGWGAGELQAVCPPNIRDISDHPRGSSEGPANEDQNSHGGEKRQAESHRGEASFATLHSHFLSAPPDDRLQFLSWLFEGTLARCIPDLGVDKGIDEEDDHLPPRKHRRSARQFKPRVAFTGDEDCLLRRLKRQNLPWSVIYQKFTEAFPAGGRSEAALQTRYSTRLKASYDNGHLLQCCLPVHDSVLW